MAKVLRCWVCSFNCVNGIIDIKLAIMCLTFTNYESHYDFEYVISNIS